MSDDEELWSQTPALDDQSRRALATAEGWIGDQVQGVAISATEDGQPCVVVYTLHPVSAHVQQLPAQVEGLPVQVVSTDAFSAED
jgi:hypothetical protein